MLNDVTRLIKTCPSGKSINIHLSALDTFLIHIVSMYYFSVLGHELKTTVIASCYTHTWCRTQCNVIKTVLICCLFQKVLRISLYCFIWCSADHNWLSSGIRSNIATQRRHWALPEQTTSDIQAAQLPFIPSPSYWKRKQGSTTASSCKVD